MMQKENNKIYIINISKRTICLIGIIILLLISYISIQYKEAKVAINNSVEFNNSNKDLSFVLGGEVTGIKLLATGVLVVGIENNDLDIEIGDIIYKVDNIVIESNQELITCINTKVKDKRKVILTIDRNGEKKEIIANTIYVPSNEKYELGLWVKDSSAGVGTLTFYEKNNLIFAGLGHGISETSENIILPITSGAIVKSEIKGINKGYTKSPGDIKGILYKDIVGQILKNTRNGIYGKLEDTSLIKEKDTIKVASKNELKEGSAYIYCALDGINIKKYEINIEKILYESTGNKNMVINVIDKNLIETTGGIIQGMSGSPIVQDERLVGAVTHVFLNDPTRGYGVFIQNMIEDIKDIK